METKPLMERVTSTLKKTTVEPFLFFVMFGYNVRLITMQSLLHDRACRVSLDFPDDICDHLDAAGNEDYQLKAVKYGNNLYNALIMLSTIPALLVATLLGPWSDRYGRKYPLIIACSCVLTDSTLQAILTSFTHSSPYLYLVCASLSGISGGFIMVLSATYSYLSDITDERSRQSRFAILEFFTLMATPMGSFVGGQVFSKAGYLPVMIIGPCCFAMALLWLLLYVAETKPRRSDITKKQMLRDIFRLDNLKESYRTCIKERPGNLRLQIWLLVIVSFSLRLIHLGSLTIGFPYTRKMFKWGVERYSYTMTLFSLLNAIAIVTVVPFLNKKMLVHEAAVGLIGVLSLMAKMILMASSIVEGIIFYAWFSGCLYACGGIAVRSRISKVVNKNELGKVFSLLATFESMTPVLGTLIMTQIYNTSVGFYPGLTYALATVLLIPAACIFSWMMHLPTMSFTQYQEAEEAKGMKELENVSSNVF